MIRVLLIAFGLFFFANNGLAQLRDSIVDPYSVNYKWEIPITAAGFGGTMYGYSRLAGLTTLDPDFVQQLNPQDLNRFDRSVLNYSESGYEAARKKSDVIMNISAGLPALLLIDKDIRKNWLDFTTLYFQAHLAGSAMYQMAAFPIRRARPLVYNTNLSIGERSGQNTSNSFFSGHTSTTATGTFFMAKVYSDFHELSWKQKAIVYGAASIPPAFVARYRIKGGKHFRTDVMTGYAIGMLSGILIPHFHKKKTSNLSALPIYGPDLKGLTLRYEIK